MALQRFRIQVQADLKDVVAQRVGIMRAQRILKEKQIFLKHLIQGLHRIMPAAAVQKGIKRLVEYLLITLVDQIIFILIAPVKAGPADVSLFQQIVDRQFV